jgi:hypothetical protein
MIYILRNPETIEAVQFDGSEKMAREIDAKCASSYCYFGADDGYLGLYANNGIRFVPAIKGDYLIWNVTRYKLMRKSDFEAKYKPYKP